MSIKVELGDLPTALAGTSSDTAFLLTTNEDFSPHPAHVRVRQDDEGLVVSAGRRSCRNCQERPTVTLLWPAQGAEAMNLLVDGVAEVRSVEEGVVVVVPTSAIWHRQPD